MSKKDVKNKKVDKVVKNEKNVDIVSILDNLFEKKEKTTYSKVEDFYKAVEEKFGMTACEKIKELRSLGIKRIVKDKIYITTEQIKKVEGFKLKKIDYYVYTNDEMLNIGTYIKIPEECNIECCSREVKDAQKQKKIIIDNKLKELSIV